jgi:outer membrane protein TolC
MHLSGQELLTLENAIQIGLENSYGIKIAENEMKIASNNAAPGNAGMLPRIEAVGSYDKGVVSAKVEHITGLELEDDNAHSDRIYAGLKLKWTLFDGLHMFNAYDMLKKFEELGEMELKIVLENTIADITIQYVDIVQKQLMMDVLNEQVEISRFRLQLAQIMKDVGSGSELELLQAQVDLNADESALYNHKTRLANAKTTLNELLSRDVYLDFTVMDTLILGSILELSSLKQNFSNNNKDIKVKQLTREAVELDLKGIKGESYPKLDFFASYDFLENSTEASFIKYNRLFGPHFGLTASVKIFDGLDQRRKIQNTQISLLNADLQIKQTQNQMESYLVRLFNDYNNDLQLIEFEQRSFDLAKRNMDIAKDSYEIGMISPIELREVQKNLLSAGYRMIQAQYRTKVKEVELLLISGQLVK